MPVLAVSRGMDINNRASAITSRKEATWHDCDCDSANQSLDVSFTVSLQHRIHHIL
jgi:hypothetical protein